MLSNLKIENIAIIESAEVEFSPGLNVLTGETGAGKSIVIDSINAVLGERTSRELIRTGAQSARVTAVFDKVADDAVAELEKLGVESNGEKTVILSRSLHADGRNVCRINGVPATVSMLKSIGARLVNIHGQHDNQALLSPDKHCGFIDSLAGNARLRADYKDCFSKLVSVKRELDSLYVDEDQKAARLELLNFQIDEIEAAALRVGEREELNSRKTLCLNAQRVLKSIHAAYAALAGENDDGAGAVDAMLSCADSLEAAAKFAPAAESAAQSAKNICCFISELSDEIRALGDNMDYNPEQLAEIDERLDLIFRLTHKYGATEQAVLDRLEEMYAERSKIELSDERASQLEVRLAELSDKTKALAARLTENRRAAAKRFEERVCAELAFLDMPNVNFIVDIKSAPFSSRGADAVEFLISANAGETPKPLVKIASGGELSRIMLAIKNVISAGDDIGTLIFDEIDTGVSGRAAQKIAMKLREVSNGRQVMCVTHLAQIAAQAGRHIRISKSVAQGKTYTEIKTLDFEQRKQELARIMGGLEVTELQLQSAQEMLTAAGINKQ